MQNGQQIEVSIVDRDQLYLQGLKQIVSLCYDISLHMATSSAQQVIDHCMTKSTDILIMSLRSDDLDVVQVLRTIRDRQLKTRIIVCEKLDPGPLLKLLLKSGVSSYLLKEHLNRSELVRVIRDVYQNGFAQTNLVTIDHYHGMSDGSPDKALFKLSRREREVLIMTCNGCSRKEIAERLFLKEATIKFHLDKLRDRFQCQNVVQLVSKSLSSGMINAENLAY